MSTTTTKPINETLTVKKRTYQATTHAKHGTPYYEQILREEVEILPDGSVHKRTELPPITRKIADVAEETITLDDGTTLTHAQVDEAKTKFSDKWEAEEDSKSVSGKPNIDI